MVDVLDSLLLVEIHSSEAGDAILLIKGNGFHVNVTMAHYFIPYLSTLSKCNTDRQTRKRTALLSYFAICEQFGTMLSCPYYQRKFLQMMERFKLIGKQHLILAPRWLQITEK